MGVLWEKVCRPTPERLARMTATLHDAEKDARLTLEVLEETWEYRKRHSKIFDRYCCVNIDAEEYMRKLREHLDEHGQVVSSGTNKKTMEYKAYLARKMCDDKTIGCRHSSDLRFLRAPEQAGSKDERTGKRSTPDRTTPDMITPERSVGQASGSRENTSIRAKNSRTDQYSSSRTRGR